LSAVVQKNWQSLIKPAKLEIEPTSNPLHTTTVVAEPLERGFGVTLGNAICRVLLSSLQGAAVTAVKIDGVPHEFSGIPGVREDVTDIVLNIKQIALRMHGDGPKHMMLTAMGPGEVRAGQIQAGHDIYIMNPDLVLCTLDKRISVGMEFIVQLGKGYVPAAMNRQENSPLGLIPIDSSYSPVRRVSYFVEPTRVGQVTDYDKLLLTVETNGALSPEDSVAQAARILQDQMQLFINFEEPQAVHFKEVHDDLPFNRNLLRKAKELELSVRSATCLENERIVYIGDLVQKSEQEMLRTANFGRKSLNEVRGILTNMGLSFGMVVAGWPPENIEELAKQVEEPF
jgi:DNA-directed RNA polymerase subunit alpha